MSLSGLGLSGLSGVAGGYAPALAGATHHWAARLESGFSGGASVTSLSDRIGSVTLSATGTPPTYETNQINGLPAFSFGGAGRLVGGGIGITGSAAAIALIVAQTNLSTEQGLLQYGASAGTGGQVRRYSPDPSIRFNNGSRVFNTPTNPTNWHIWTGFNAAGANYGNHRYLVDGVEMTQLSVSAPGTVPNLANQETLIGVGRNSSGTGNIFLTGFIAEVVFVPTYSVALVNYHGSRLASIYGLSWTNFAG